MIYLEFYNLILYLKKKIKSNLNISSIISIKSSQMFLVMYMDHIHLTS